MKSIAMSKTRLDNYIPARQQTTDNNGFAGKTSCSMLRAKHSSVLSDLLLKLEIIPLNKGMRLDYESNILQNNEIYVTFLKSHLENDIKILQSKIMRRKKWRCHNRY